MLHARGPTCLLLTGLCLLASPFHADAYLVAGVPEQPFAQAFVWSRWDQGQRLGVGTGRSDLWYGQPLELTVVAPPTATPAPDYRRVFLRVWWADLTDRIKQTATVELTDHRGKPVEHTLTVLSSSDSIATGHRSVIRLSPTPGGAFHFPPGEYRIRIRVRMDEADADANSYAGTLETPWIELEIWDTDPASREARLEAYLSGVAKQINNARTPAMLQAVEKRLRRDLFDPQHILLIPALETLAGGNNPATAAVAKRLLRNLLFPLVQLNRPGPGYFGDTTIDNPTLGVLGETSWQLVRELDTGDALAIMQAKAAACSPLPPHVDLPNPTEAQLRELTARLRDDSFAVRMAAVRSIGHTTDPRVIQLLVERFDDPYSYTIHNMPGMPVPTHPVADTAMQQVIQLDDAALPMLLESADKLDGRARWRAERALAKIGPDPKVLAYFANMLKADNAHQRHTAIHYLRQLGPKSAPILRPLAENPATDTTLRRLALGALSTVDPSKETAKLLRRLVADREADGPTRQSCIWSLSQIAPDESTRNLLAQVADDPDDPMHELAAQRLEAMHREQQQQEQSRNR